MQKLPIFFQKAMRVVPSFMVIMVFAMFMANSSSAQQSQPLTDDGMNNTRLEKLLRSNAAQVEGQPGVWEAYVANTTVYVITDETHNRMRIFSAIGEAKELQAEHLTFC